jgi:hypothetical protein
MSEVDRSLDQKIADVGNGSIAALQGRRLSAKSSRSLAALNSHHKRTMTGLPHRQHTWAAMAP